MITIAIVGPHLRVRDALEGRKSTGVRFIGVGIDRPDSIRGLILDGFLCLSEPSQEMLDNLTAATRGTR